MPQMMPFHAMLMRMMDAPQPPDPSSQDPFYGTLGPVTDWGGGMYSGPTIPSPASQDEDDYKRAAFGRLLQAMMRR